ncbi:MAG: hypothetical protein QXU40_00610 [Candidatus Pacearchaeota archaeon]
MEKYKWKKGSHIEVILSFSIFILLLSLLYLILKPAALLKEKEEITKLIENVIIDQVSSEITITPIKIINVEDNMGCSILNDLFLSGRYSNKIIARDDGGVVFEIKKVGNNLEIRNSHKNFFRIYSSNEFQDILENNAGDEGCQQKNYETGVKRVEKMVSEKKIYSLKERYENDYAALKTEIGLEKQRDFGFEFFFMNNTNISTNFGNFKGSVFVKRIPILYFTNNASIEAGVLVIRVW